jgi:hypothetical protein
VRLFGGRRRDRFEDLERLEQRQRDLTQAIDQWLSLLREMEGSGESGDPNYARYYRAYVEAKQQEKKIDLELFNIRHGLLR